MIEIIRYPTPPALIEITRGDRVESVHRAHVCVVDTSGNRRLSFGDYNHKAFLRSSAKPLQALAVIVSGAAEAYQLSEREIAIISGSHGGEKFHVETVLSILAKAGLDQKALQCGIQRPLDASASRELYQSNQKPMAVHHNCSGKHAGMLLTAKYLGLDIDNYLDPTHIVQKRIVELIARVSDLAVAQVEIGIDGCSAPVHAIPLKNAALAYARMINTECLATEIALAFKTIANSMRTFPEMVAANQNRLCTELMRVGSNLALTAKAGAEGYYAVAWRDPETDEGVGMALKVEDGAQRGRDPLVIKLLQLLRVLPDPLPELLEQFAERPIMNFAEIEVGNIRVRL
ncbi:asparaginase [bacterium]|nr:asparaginase [bacterium]